MAGELSLAESIPLVAAWASRVADEAGARLLLIKGQPAADLGVRAPRPAVDVDVWVAPDQHSAYVALLLRHGWMRMAGSPVGVGWGHAVTLHHHAWPTTIDVHRFFPGFLADEDAVFDLVWDRRSHHVLASGLVATPDRICALVITALHAARSHVLAEPQADADVARRVVAAMPEVEREALVAFLHASGAAATVADTIPSLAAGSATPAHLRRAVSEWRLRTGPAGTGVPWLMAFRSVPRRAWPRLVLAASHPTPSDYANTAVGGTGWRHGVRASLYRWRRGVAALPAGVRRVRLGVRHSPLTRGT